jgi:hypothetical protein
MALPCDQPGSRIQSEKGLTLISVTLGLALAFGCQAPGETAPAKPTEPFKPAISLRPVGVSLAKGATQTFQAEINYPEGARTPKQPVAWRVVELDGGGITAMGLYTAPAFAGTYHVQVRREDFPEITAVATVTVK